MVYACAISPEGGYGGGHFGCICSRQRQRRSAGNPEKYHTSRDWRAQSIIGNTISAWWVHVYLILLARGYLILFITESVEILLPQFPETLVLPTRPVLTFILASAVLLLSSAKSLASKRIVYATWLSVFTYIALLSCLSFAYTHGTLQSNPNQLRLGTFWQGISCVSFSLHIVPRLTFFPQLPPPLYSPHPPHSLYTPP